MKKIGRENSGLAQRKRESSRGFFVVHTDAKFRDILDGLANTIMAGEIPTDLGDKDVRTQAYINAGRNGGVYDDPGIADTNGWKDAARPQFWDPSVTSVQGCWRRHAGLPLGRTRRRLFVDVHDLASQSRIGDVQWDHFRRNTCSGKPTSRGSPHFDGGRCRDLHD